MGQTENKLEILELIGRYTLAVDEKDPQAYADVFTEDGVLVSNIVREGLPNPFIFRGRNQLIEGAKIFMSTGERQTRHFKLSTTFLELTADRALTRSYLLVTSTEPGKTPTLSSTGVYEDQIVRTPRGWRFDKVEPIVDGLPGAFKG